MARGASPALLDSYEAERRPIALDVLALSNARLTQAIEQRGISTGRDASTMQLGIHYRGSSLARDDRDAAALLRAGDRAPDATKLMTAEGEQRLFDLTRGGQFTLLNFGPATAFEVSPFELRTLQVRRQLTGLNELIDADGHLARAYTAADRTLVLVRPDGYIALISDAGDAHAISDYFSALEML